MGQEHISIWFKLFCGGLSLRGRDSQLLHENVQTLTMKPVPEKTTSDSFSAALRDSPG